MTGPGAAASGPEVSQTEAAVVGLSERGAIDTWVAHALTTLVGESVESVLLRSGRIDAVYGLATDTGRQLLLKVHRQPIDREARRLVNRAQSLLAEIGFPCAHPLVGPDIVDGRVVSVETLLPAGAEGDGHEPRIRRLIAAGLAQQVEVLAARPDLVAAVGEPPAWCDYTHGAWGRTHDPFFDFSTTPPEYGWLQELAQDASEELMNGRGDGVRVAAHGDWYCGNLRFEGDRLVAAFDWDLIADREPVVAGIAAATFSGEPSPNPQETAAFLREYEDARGIRFSAAERAAAAAAVRWNLAYSARCDVTNLDGAEPQPGSALERLAGARREYLDLDW